MTRLPHSQACTAAANDLAWCLTPPHHIDTIADLAAARFPKTRWHHGITNDEMAATMRNEAENEGGHTAWSDPTADAVASGAVYAMTRWADTAPVTVTAGAETIDSPSPSALDSAVDLVYYSTSDLITLCLDNERITSAYGLEDRLRVTVDALHRVAPLIVQARVRMDRPDRDLCDELVYLHISETAEWLRQKGEALCNGSKRAAQPVPLPGDLPKGCVSCARDRDGAGRPYLQPVDEHNHSKRKMCRVCGDYYSGNGVMLPLFTVQEMHRGKQVTNKLIEAGRRAEMMA